MPPKLGWSDALGRMTRIEPVEEQGILTWDLVRRAVLEQAPEEAVEWLRYIKEGENAERPNQPGVKWTIQNQLQYIAQRYGEEHVERALRWWRRKLIDAAGEPTYSMTPLERVQYHATLARADYAALGGGRFPVWEDSDKYGIELDCCNGCGPMRRADTDGTGPNLGRTTKGYSWSWGKSGVPYYCTHSCLWWEVMSIEDLGYPVRVHEWSEDPNKACKVLFFKEPSLIPEEYFTRVGKAKEVPR